ncbi:MAG: radical SAM family heme chaperone HemW [Tannerella sp.]|jgi:oxygen-independent coproporphyrinogen-3 oxidase|nr:radical SAM family heme chaperone HemW [Tannerella sp.]
MAGLYIHVPFCAGRCTYCDFFSQTETKYKAPFVQAIVRELEMRKEYLNDEPIETIYFGGGTPSQLQLSDFECIFESIERFYGLSACREITLEANPDDLSPEYLSTLQSLPFNRISLGVQSFRDEDLRMLNRRHNGRQAVDAIHLCRDKGYTNLSLDLIYGLPGQTPEMWEENLDTALRLDMPHLSAYHLSYEEGTVIHRQLENGMIRPVDEETSVHLFHTLINRLTAAGYLHYELSNFGKPDCFSRHNTAYWTGRKYIGLGPAAHSYDHVSRQWNIASLPEYIRGIIRGTPAIEKEILDLRSQYNDYVMTRLRTMWGIRLSTLRETFGQELSAYFLRQAQPHLRNGMLQKTDETIRFTSSGLFVSDGILSDLMKL